MLKAFGTTLKTELKLATRNADMIFFGIGFPVGAILILGFISSPEALRLDFGGVVAFGIAAAGVMGLPLTLADYRHRKILKRMRATPASPLLLLGAQALVQCAFVFVSAGIVFLIAALGFGVRLEGSLGRFMLTFLFVMVSIFGLGLLIGSLAPNAKVANALTSLLYFPMVFLSGATIPFEILPRPVQVAMEAFPLTQGIKLIKGAVLGSPLDGLLLPLAFLSLLALASYALAIRFFKWE